MSLSATVPTTIQPCYAALIRHGDYHHQPDTPGASQPYPLNAAGQQQACQCVDMLTAFSDQQQLPIASEIHTSSLLRAWQTAEIIAQQFPDAILIPSVRLGERCVGSLANLTVAEIEQIIHDDPRYADLPEGWKSNSHYCLPYPGAESLMQAGRRVADYIMRTMHTENMQQTGQQTEQQRYPNGFIQLFVGHGAAFRHAAHHLGMLNLDEIRQLSMHHARPVFLQRSANGGWHHHSGAWKQRANISRYTD